MLLKVIVRSSLTDIECEELINKAIADYPNYSVAFDMLIENTVSLIGGNQKTMYTLLIRIEVNE